MIALLGIVGLLMLVITIGKRQKEIRPISYIFVVVIALLQVMIVLYDIYTMEPPIF
ncbi:MAG: hypothetical protein HY707_07275 [Ignavibacteriae bacterium]|nr:hypothetical protein [Ignavibacteriota bacterium]